ncbi:hypothetical protein J6590_067634 [Homalodisca vitripennis]|nr:hypothetical protein J6590_067634 [Homalodisca vitripennis]
MRSSGTALEVYLNNAKLKSFVSRVKRPSRNCAIDKWLAKLSATTSNTRDLVVVSGTSVEYGDRPVNFTGTERPSLSPSLLSHGPYLAITPPTSQMTLTSAVTVTRISQ